MNNISHEPSRCHSTHAPHGLVDRGYGDGIDSVSVRLVHGGRMPRKIGFVVASSSGHEDNFSANELMVHAPTVHGWRSARFCTYPQEITLQVTERCRLKKLQLLAHQFMIPSEVEFHIADSPLESGAPNHVLHFRRLGYVSLSDNEKTAFGARELKSVYIDAVGTHLKLIFNKSHINCHNLYNQVALVAINILGDHVDASEVNSIPTRDHLIEQYISSSQRESALDGTYSRKYESLSPLDDLAFDMYQDPEMAQIIRSLNDKKQEMVRLERYDIAKKLKQAIADFQKVGEHLGRCHVEKRSAIEKEDYDTARLMKEQMEEYRLMVYQQLQLHDLLDVDQIQTMSEVFTDELNAPPHSAKATPEVAQRTQLERPLELENFTPQTATPEQTHSATPRLPVPQIDVNFLPFDERPIPTLRNRESPCDRLPLAIADPLSNPHSPIVSDEPEPLTEKAQRDASLAIEVYGDDLVAGAYSKKWSYREDALLAVCKKLTESSPGMSKGELRNMMRAAVFLTKKTLLDNVSSVFQASLKLLEIILTQFVTKHHLGKAEVAHCLEQIWPNLLSRTGDSSSRVRAVAMTFIQEMALFKEVRSLQIIPGELVKPMKYNTATRVALSRMELLEWMVEKFGTQDSGFTVDNVMKFLTGTLDHSASSVREMAVKIIYSMYRLHRNTVLDYLPANSANTRKNVLYKTIFDGFGRIDGHSVVSQTSRMATGQDPQREREEIRSLQDQLVALKEISEKGKETAKVLEKKAANTIKAVNKKVPYPSNSKQPHPTESENRLATTKDSESLCIFCGEKDEAFTDEGLDLHYWKHCPMLRRCVQCRQVVEISGLTDHLLMDCENNGAFMQCARCTEAVHKDQLSEHAQSSACNPPGSGKASNHCPLCHENFAPGEEVRQVHQAWKWHLMSREGCTQNPRRAALSQRPRLSQGRTITLGATKPKAGVSKGKIIDRGTKILPTMKANRPGHSMPAKQ
ncbi:centrosomal protein of 104 kDa isoform X2 [Denticeps clupeoides]|uniref:centrosomal protein of 104 kDa isoform X2 n=1 Tax=Denticeps clupeoides TaxID=299321 RepID=UPI0010A39593|nr:centrosomal protein of 104 kDa isoform X2 [Denticeps clupeoides]